MKEQQLSAAVDLTQKGALDHATSIATQLASKGVSGQVALKGNANQLLSGISALSSKGNLASAVITLRGSSPAKAE